MVLLTWGGVLFMFCFLSLSRMSFSTKKTNKAQDPRKGDDRNLVIVDQDFGQPDLEDRIWLFWIRNRVAILSLVTIAVVGTLGAIGWFAFSDYRLSVLQDAFLRRADTVEAKLAFARDNSGQPLAGVSALEAADLLQKEKKYAEAAEAYALARSNFNPADKNSAAFAGRALNGFAFAKLFGGDRDGAVKALTELARSPAYTNAQRGEAFYNLALLALEKNDVAGARKWLDDMDRDIPPNTAWALLKHQLIFQVPALNTPTPLPPVSAAPGTPSAAPVAAPEKPEEKPAPAAPPSGENPAPNAAPAAPAPAPPPAEPSAK